MHICYTTDYFLPEYGGIQTHVHELSKVAIKNGHKVTVVTSVESERMVEKIDNINVIRVKYPKYAGFFALSGLKNRLYKIFRKIDPDIIHAHHAFSPMGLATAHAAKKIGIPAILTNHSIPIGYEAFKRLWNYFSRIFLLYQEIYNIRKYDAIIAVSTLAAEYIRVYYPKGRIFVVPPPVESEFFNVSATKEDIGFNSEDKIVLFVGRLALKKGIEFALYSFRLISLLEPKAKLCVVGPYEKAYMWHVKILVKSWGLEDKVIFVGPVDRELLRKFYAASDVFIFPSYGGESFGIVVLESMATGTPVVATSGGALKKYIERYGLGYITGFSPVKFARAVIRLLNNPTLRDKIGKKCRIFARLFSWDRIFSKIMDIYRLVMEND